MQNPAKDKEIEQNPAKDKENEQNPAKDKLIDPVLDEKNERSATFPLKFMDIWYLYKKHELAIWHAHEISFTDEKKDWQKLTNDERKFIKTIIAFFATSDSVVSNNISLRFRNEVKITESRYFYDMQALIENIHSETYSMLVDTYADNEKERNDLFNAVQTNQTIAKKAKWGQQWITNDTPFAQRLLAFAIVEGIFFSAAFCSIFWISKRGILKALKNSNDFISRDEGMHVEHAVLLYTKYIVNKISEECFHKMLKDAVDIEIEFIVGALPFKLNDMNADLMIQYVQFVADRLSTQLGFEKLYNKDNPFPFMELTSLLSKTNFFEDRPNTYSSGVIGEKNEDPFADL